ncbi:hypothetical protein JY98_15450 [Exiguobacterium mexicanum]|nr:hypothetical protein JY98_15450 [Exiguobacterium mexicanum]
MGSLVQTLDAKEVDLLLKMMIIKIDTREQKNEHIVEFLDSRGIAWQSCKLDAGDYGAFIPATEGITDRPLHLNAVIERKNSLDELAQTVKERNRFENELSRAKRRDTRFIIMVEDGSYSGMIRKQYRSEYAAKALTGSLMAFEARYNVSIQHVAKADAGHYMYYWLYYQFREALLSM